MLEYLRGAVERFRARPAQLLLGLLKVLFAEGRAVALRRSFERGTVADFRVADDDRGFIQVRAFAFSTASEIASILSGSVTRST